MRALDRVSWRQRGEPHRVIVFDFDNQTGQDTLAPVAREIAEAVRAAVARRAGSQVVGDSAARATAGTTERRRVGDELLAGALVAGGIYRRGSDSLTVRATVRDMSEERNFPTIEVRTLLTTPKDALPALLERLTADFERINWGPKGTQPPAARTP
jgi:TolB-like protein